MTPSRLLIVSKPGPGLDSLNAVLPAILCDVEIFQTETGFDAIRQIGIATPDLLLIDTGIGEVEAKEMIGYLFSFHRDIGVILLSEAVHWNGWRLRNHKAQVLLKGFTTAQLKAAILAALSRATTHRF